MDRKLEELQEKARALRIERQAGGEATERSARSKRPSPFRILIWICEFLILLFALYYFIIAPWQARREAERQRYERPTPAGTPVALLGDEARSLDGLREVENAYLARVDDLAPGSRSARDGQATISRERRLPVEVVNTVGMRFRLIPEGTFLIGSPPTEPHRWEGERQHVRHVPRPFYMGATPVTQQQWHAVMGTNPAYFKTATRPVEEVTWHDCQAFVAALAEKEGVPKGTYRLPSEVEWEYAARAGTQTTYFFGNNPARLRQFDWYNDNSGGRSAPVARLRPNAFGLYDVHGNVWEWCRNLFAPYPGTDDLGRVEADFYSIRGGNWYAPPEDCRLAMRSRLPPDSHGNILGFRIMRVIPELAGDEENEPR